MVNPRIAPPAELDVDERIVEIEKFLEEQEKPRVPEKLEEPMPEDVLTLL